jgi:hypothetical protein
MIEVKRERDPFGTMLTARCECGATIEHFVERGASVSDVPGPFPDDIECDNCGAWFNASGQEINPRGDFDPEIDRWDDDY